MNLSGQSVIIDLRSALGDSIAWMRSVELFTEKHQCKTTVIQKSAYIDLFKKTHPEYNFIPREEWDQMAVPQNCYARYICCTDCMGEGRRIWQPQDYRMISVQECGDYVLDVKSHKTAPKIDVPNEIMRDEK